MLDIPKKCYVNKFLPKKIFYEKIAISSSVKEEFTNQVDRITWLYKISSDTIGISKTNNVEEIEVFKLDLKEKIIPKNVIKVITKGVPYKILFLLKYNEEYCYLLKIDDIYNLEWNKDINIDFNAINLEVLYENIAKTIIDKKEDNRNFEIIIEEKRKIDDLNKKISNLKIIKNKTNKNSKVKNKIISVVGTPGVGKSIFISLFSKNVKNKKILIIDFDIYNKSLDLIFGYNTKNQKEKSIIKVNNNIELLSKIEIFFKENYIEKNKIRNILNSFSKKYDLIIIDNTSEYSCEYTKEILKNSDSIIFLSDANLIELNKTKKLLEKYINKWKIEKEKFNVVFNKININSINNKILNNLFSDFNILGKINFSNKYNLIINNNLKMLNKNINKEYINIIKKMKIN